MGVRIGLEADAGTLDSGHEYLVVTAGYREGDARNPIVEGKVRPFQIGLGKRLVGHLERGTGIQESVFRLHGRCRPGRIQIIRLVHVLQDIPFQPQRGGLSVGRNVGRLQGIGLGGRGIGAVHPNLVTGLPLSLQGRNGEGIVAGLGSGFILGLLRFLFFFLGMIVFHAGNTTGQESQCRQGGEHRENSLFHL